MASNCLFTSSYEVLTDLYMDLCFRARIKYLNLLDSDVEHFLDNSCSLSYLLGQIDLLEILLDGVFSRDFLKKLKGPLDDIDNISIRG